MLPVPLVFCPGVWLRALEGAIARVIVEWRAPLHVHVSTRARPSLLMSVATWIFDGDHPGLAGQRSELVHYCFGSAW